MRGDATEAFRQHPRVAVGHHRGQREHVTGLDHGIQQTHFYRAAELAVAILGVVVAVYRQYAERALAAAAAGAGVEFQAIHRKRIEAETHRTLSESGFELADKTLGPGFGIAIAGGARLALAVIAVEVEVAGQHVQGAAFDKPFGFFFHGHA